MSTIFISKKENKITAYSTDKNVQLVIINYDKLSEILQPIVENLLVENLIELKDIKNFDEQTYNSLKDTGYFINDQVKNKFVCPEHGIFVNNEKFTGIPIVKNNKCYIWKLCPICNRVSIMEN